MFDIGWLELIVIGIVALIVVGPNDLPGMFRTVGRFMGKARAMAREFQRSMEEAANETGLKEAATGLKKMNDLGLNSATKSASSYAKSFLKDQEDAERAADAEHAAETPEPAPKPKAGTATTPPAAAAPDTAPAPDPAPAADDKAGG